MVLLNLDVGLQTILLVYFCICKKRHSFVSFKCDVTFDLVHKTPSRNCWQSYRSINISINMEYITMETPDSCNWIGKHYSVNRFKEDVQNWKRRKRTGAWWRIVQNILFFLRLLSKGKKTFSVVISFNRSIDRSLSLVQWVTLNTVYFVI